MPTWITVSRWWASSAAARDGNDRDAWLNTVHATRATRRLNNIDPKTNQRVPAPNPHATSVIPASAPKTTFIDPATGALGNVKTMPMSNNRTTKRL